LLRTEDFAAAYERLRANGVRFVQDPRDAPYGRVALFLDISGNRWDLLGPSPLTDRSQLTVILLA